MGMEREGYGCRGKETCGNRRKRTRAGRRGTGTGWGMEEGPANRKEQGAPEMPRRGAVAYLRAPGCGLWVPVPALIIARGERRRGGTNAGGNWRQGEGSKHLFASPTCVTSNQFDVVTTHASSCFNYTCLLKQRCNRGFEPMQASSLNSSTSPTVHACRCPWEPFQGCTLFWHGFSIIVSSFF